MFSNSGSSTDPEDEMTVHQYVGKWESVTPFAANQSSTKNNDKNTAGQTGMVMLQVRVLILGILDSVVLEDEEYEWGLPIPTPLLS